MSANGTRSIIWINGEDQFCLSKAGLILDLEEKCGAGIAMVFWRLQNDAWKYNDIRETIRLGLIGGGMSPVQAMSVVKLHVDGQPLAPLVLVAYAVLQAVMVGVPDDPVGKEEPAEAKKTGSTTQTDASDDLNSTPSAKRLAGHHVKPTKPRSGNSLPA